MTEPTVPVLRVVKGDPSPEELAALVAVVAGRAANADRLEPERRSTWARYWRSAHPPVRPGAGAWRASSLPR
ncbi:MAG: acyl-CoA carboxylase subunit epsilon [Jiangellaceae bacterium]